MEENHSEMQKHCFLNMLFKLFTFQIAFLKANEEKNNDEKSVLPDEM